jgi:hypothetical protein
MLRNETTGDNSTHHLYCCGCIATALTRLPFRRTLADPTLLVDLCLLKSYMRRLGFLHAPTRHASLLYAPVTFRFLYVLGPHMIYVLSLFSDFTYKKHYTWGLSGTRSLILITCEPPWPRSLSYILSMYLLIKTCLPL